MVVLVNARLSDCAILAIVFETIKDALKHVCFEFSNSGLLVRTRDEGGNVKIFFHLKAEYFSLGYVCNKNASFSIPLSVLLKCLKLAKRDGVLEICYKEENSSKPISNNPNYELQLTFLTASGNSRIFTPITHHLLTGQDHIQENISRSICDVKMPSKLFANKVRKLSADVETISFMAKERNRRMVFEMAADIDGIEGFIPITNNMNECVLNIEDTFKYTYSSRFLKEFIKGAKLAKDMTARFPKHCNNDAPYHVMALEYKIMNSSERVGGHLRFYIRNQLK